MPSGIVKWFSVEKGYGFIAPTDGSDDDAFVHISDMQASGLLTLRAGDDVHFDRSTNRRTGKLKAVSLRMIETIGGK